MKVWIKVFKILIVRKLPKVWVHNYQNNKNLTHRNGKPILYKVKKEQVKNSIRYDRQKRTTYYRRIII